MLKKISGYIIVLCIGAAIGTYFDAAHTIEEKVIFKDRIRTVTKEVIKENPDGSKTTEREVITDEKKDGLTSKKESKPVKKDWGVGVKYDLFTPVPVWTAEVHRRIFSDIYVSAHATTDGRFGVGVTLFF